MSDVLKIEPIGRVEGEIRLPGSKSLSNRALLLAALSKGETTLYNLLQSDDTHYMIEALKELGVSLEYDPEHALCRVVGRGSAFVHDEKLRLYLGNAGTAMRPLCAVLSAGQGEYELTGNPRMKERPIGALVDALQGLGADIDYLENAGYPPLALHAHGLRGGETTIDATVSSQFLSALLMAAPLSQTPVTVRLEKDPVSKPYIDITLDLMRRFGVPVEKAEGYRRFQIEAPQCYRSPGEYLIEGDASSASYFLAAAAIKGGCVTVHGIGKRSIQGDVAFVDVLEKMGAKVEWGETHVTVCRAEKLKAVDMDFNHIPDAAMTIATAALFAEGTTVLRNIYNWRVKETDRLSAMATELHKTGAAVEEGEDYLKITPPQRIKHAEIDTYDDHRMAMAFSLLALDPASVTIRDPGCCAKTFPEYFEYFESIAKRS